VLYRKNIRQWEQWSRVVIGLGVAGFGLLANWGTIPGYALAATGVILAVTGIFGWCPACAMVGRRLREK
jgi:hypothetical protein